MPKITTTKFGHLTDQELVILIQQNPDYLGEVYKRCKQYCIQFMRKMTNGSKSDYELDDVFHDSMLVLYEKIIKEDFELTASLQTYLNSVCRFQLLNKLGKEKLYSDYDDDGGKDDDENPMGYKSSITDSLDEIEDPKESQFTAIERALLMMKEAGGHCYELLTLFWYHKKSMNELTQHFGYSNSDNTKNQKAKCQKRLEKIAFNVLNT
ncbi:sigma-70 family RNA polymerase sigma factor [Flavobacterium taihuense]|uniref:Sigma-70 family RNA polymerase sigma factor n=1 Tax=Flavobacterium taihuense TaxID=2857508 RepID=A0ABS6XRX2_9FLAO|nr:sigma-70 family RNA polymerase sigma factor [Flavobacterium taihuense]MBW4359384.1 sigma-70 family RNA polymerase sigma factor [Flavobacterium taihuense]